MSTHETTSPASPDDYSGTIAPETCPAMAVASHATPTPPPTAPVEVDDILAGIAEATFDDVMTVDEDDEGANRWIGILRCKVGSYSVYHTMWPKRFQVNLHDRLVREVQQPIHCVGAGCPLCRIEVPTVHLYVPAIDVGPQVMGLLHASTKARRGDDGRLLPMSKALSFYRQLNEICSRKAEFLDLRIGKRTEYLFDVRIADPAKVPPLSPSLIEQFIERVTNDRKAILADLVHFESAADLLARPEVQRLLLTAEA